MRQLQKDIHKNARNHGWWDEPKVNIPEKLALIHSEVSEALEDYRDNKMDMTFDNGKPVGFPVELADAVIRIFDLAEFLGYDMEIVMECKHRYNVGRPYRHGGKAA